MNKKIAIIGMGHMGKALQQGLLARGLQQKNILTSNSSRDNKRVAEQADWIILAVKPSQLEEVVRQVTVSSEKLLFSVAAGVTVAQISAWSENKNSKIVRLMPNLPIAYGQGVIGFYANKNVSLAEKRNVQELLRGLGEVIEVKDEWELDVLTVLSGSGPALVAYCVAMFATAGESLGLSAKNANQAAMQTFIGTLSYLQMTGQTPIELQKSVATKGGVTEEIIKDFDAQDLSLILKQSFRKGYAKIEQVKLGVKK